MKSPATPDFPQFPTLRQACKRAGIGERAGRAGVRRGEVEVIYVPGSWPRVRWAQFEAWVRSHTTKPTNHAEARVAELLEREEGSA